MYVHAQRRSLRTPKYSLPRCQPYFRVEILIFSCIALMLYANIVRLSNHLVITPSLTTPTAYAAQSTALMSIPFASPMPTPATAVATLQTKTVMETTSTSAPVAPDKAVASVVKECTGSHYTMPEPLTPTQSGLSVVFDNPQYYQVYGSSISELREAIQNCPLRISSADDAALTSYQLNWEYDTSTTNGVCSISNVRVGLHINQYLPLFIPDDSTSGTVASDWVTFANSLTTHENGHAALDRQYAQQLTTALEAIGPLSCITIAEQVSSTTNNYVTMLDFANNSYDTQTSHGAKQGAVL